MGNADTVSTSAPRNSGSSPRVWGTPPAGRRGVGDRRFIPACVGNAAPSTGSPTRSTVHPRVCGERLASHCPRHCAIGSSPRVWGTPTTPIRQPTARAVHPRVCGERRLIRPQLHEVHGSSPRVWGTLPRSRFGRPPIRFIPACVGNARVNERTQWHTSVHPRVCGERAVTLHSADDRRGSSPRVWGTRRRCAPPCWRAPVHPRVCGERTVAHCLTRWHTGSSPRVWGTRFRFGHAALAVRFIPACVGNAACACGSTGSGTVHPRVCGERPVVPQTPVSGTGSSPRVWGTRRQGRVVVQGRRFIPACVGNASEVKAACVAQPVHPRVCGERMSDAACWGSLAGSSPRVWGTPHCPGHAKHPRRFIPACVGNATPRTTRRPGRAVHPRVCGERDR